MNATEQHLVIRHMRETSHLYFVALLVLQLATTLIFFGYIETAEIALWLAPQWLFAVILLISVNNYRVEPPPGQSHNSSEGVIKFSLLIIGGLWALSAFIFKVPDSPAHLTSHLVLLLGIASSAVIPSSYWPPVFYFFPFPILVSVTIRLISEDSVQYKLLGVCTILYLVVMLVAARRQRSILKDVITLQQHNETLIKELRYQKEIAVSANAEKSRFLAAASHDLRQPIYAIGLLASNLDGESREDERKDTINSIRRAASSLNTIVSSLLDISKLDSGKINPCMSHFILHDLIEKVITDHAPIADHKGIEIILDWNKVAVHSDPVLLEVVLRNVIGNALRYTESGHIHIQIKPADSSLDLSITDTGIGIPENELENVFKEFYKPVSTSTFRDPNSNGSGLGLSIVKRLLSVMDHRFILESSLGSGTRFSIELPLGEEINHSTPLHSEGPGESSLQGARILLVDDDIEILQATLRLLEGWGCEAYPATRFADALKMASMPFDLLITDLHLNNGTNGIQLARSISEKKANSFSTIFITADTQWRRFENCLSGHTVLCKPVSSGELHSVLTRELDFNIKKIINDKDQSNEKHPSF